MDISPDQVRTALLSLVAFILSVSVHEFGHAWMADRLGDRMPRAQGRLTLSPLAHIDPIGTIAVPLLAAFLPFGLPLIAWGKPVQTNPASYTRALSPRTGHMLVSLMGPAMNLLLAVAVSVVFIILAKTGKMSLSLAQAIIQYLLALNIVLLFFNLIPVPPLDGVSVLAGILPERLQIIPQTLQRYGMILFFILVLTPGVMRTLLRPAFRVIMLWTDALMRFVPA
jgi:Zn-dependent protease